MASYVVMEPPARGASGAVLVRDGFHVVAFLLPVVWLAFYRLWIEALAVLAAGIVAGALGSWFGFGALAGVASLVLGIFVGLEATTLRVAALRRRGWHEWGVVEAGDAGEAEIRYVAERTSAERGEAEPVTVAPATVQPHAARQDHRASGPALGMLGYPSKG